MQWIVSQIGARQHYATPRAFQRRGELRTFYTDVWAGRAGPLLRRLPGRGRAIADRSAADVPDDRVVASNVVSLFEQATARWRVGRGSAATFDEWAREGKRFAGWVNRRLDRRPPDPATDAFYGCMSVCLETLRMLGDRGVFTVVDQADPAAVEHDLVRQERERWPGWEPAGEPVPRGYLDRLAAEWAAADLVLVYSDWTKEAIVRQGAVAEKVVVVPLAYEHRPAAEVAEVPRDRSGRLTVLWLGTVILRKGIPYLIEAARRLADRPIDFVVAGPVHVSDAAVASAPANVRFVGRVFRGEAAAAYAAADLFVLPTISDSFALTQVEAMSHGLPVIATPRCGRVVTDGVDGTIVPPADADALAAAIAALHDDRPRLAAMSAAARRKAATFTLDAYGRQVYDEVARRRPTLAADVPR